MDAKTFASRLTSLSLSNLDKALAVLWWSAEHDSCPELSVQQLREFLSTNGLGNPSTTFLKNQLNRTRKTLKSPAGYRLSVTGAKVVYEMLAPILDQPTATPQDSHFLHESIWKNSRGYLERVCTQLNGCFHHGYYDAAAVMIRRAVETLIIEGYEKLQRQSEIQGPDGNYFMLGELVNRATAPNGLSLGREGKVALAAIKSLGDRSAHNRRFNARRPDLESIRSGFRVAFEELATISGMR